MEQRCCDNLNTKRGFTIIELIISIFILSIAVVGIYSAFSMMVVLTADASDRLTAAYLAQEGIEVIRNIRDTNWLSSSFVPETSWTQSFSNCTSDIGGCEADYKTMGTDSSPLLPYGTGSNSGDYLKIDTSSDGSGFYNYTTGSKTKFKRKILVSFLDAHPEIVKVTVTVFWDVKPNILNQTGGLAGNPGSGSVAVEEYFYDWYNYISD